MAPRAAPRSGCPGRPALPCPALPYLSPTPQGTGSDWKNLPGTAHTDRHHCCFNLYINASLTISYQIFKNF